MRTKTNLNKALIMTVFLLGMAPAIAAGDVIYVDADRPTGGNGTTWANAYKYLQDALYKPPTDGDEIWVAEGTYYPDEDEAANVTPNDRTETFQLINGVGIYGGFPTSGDPNWNDRDPNVYETILSGDIGVADVNTDNSYHVVTGSGTEPNAILDGFTIVGGNANGGGDNNYGGGMYNSSSSPMVINCTFSGNSADADGGGMFNYNSSPTVTNCMFSGNRASGFGVFNRGGGMCNNNDSSPTVNNCTFSGNTATGEYGNGGGMCNRSGSSPTLTNCTFSGNWVTYFGGGMRNSNSNPTLTNCILWGNSAPTEPEIYNDGGSSPAVNYCCVEDWSGGGWGNIDDDPCFVDPNGLDGIVGTEDDNLRLSADSNCIDAGDNTVVPADTADLDNDVDTTERTPLDLDGLDRFVDDPNTTDTGVFILSYYPENVDMGAYEFYGGPACGDAEHPYPVGDLNHDCHIDFFDIAIVAAHWLECTTIECD